MNWSYTAIVKQDGEWWIGWFEEIPGVNFQERTRDELVRSLRTTLAEALEMNRAEAKEAAGAGLRRVDHSGMKCRDLLPPSITVSDAGAFQGKEAWELSCDARSAG